MTPTDVLPVALAAILGTAFGILIVSFLSVHPTRMSGFLLAATTAAFAIVALVAFGAAGLAQWAALAAALVTAVLGYAWMTRRVLSREDSRPVPALIRRRGDPGVGHTAIVYFTHGEPETYDPIGWLNQFREFDGQKIRFIPTLVRPLFLFALRQHYLVVGKSDHRRGHQEMVKSLERTFREQGDLTTRLYLCFLDDNPRPDAAFIQALNDGASRVVVAEVFVSISNHTEEGRHLIEAVDMEGIPVEVRFAGPLWDSATLHGMFVQRAAHHLEGLSKREVGVLLVGHGQPDEWDAMWPTETQHEVAFRQSIMRRLEEDGYPPENLGLAWMDFKSPKPAALVEELVSRGVKRILYFAAAISADSMHSQYDIPMLVRRAKVPAGVTFENLGAWNDDPPVIRAIREIIDDQLAMMQPALAGTLDTPPAPTPSGDLPAGSPAAAVPEPEPAGVLAR